MLLWSWGIQIYFWVCVFISFRYIPRSGIAGLYDSSIFNFLSILHTVFLNGCTNIPAHDQGFPFLHIYISMLSLVFLIMGILTVMKSYLIVVLIYISLIANDVEHLFMYLLAICVCSLEKCRLTFFAHVLNIAMFIFLLLSCKSSL